MGNPLRPGLRARLQASRHDERGLTLVEMMVASALMLLVMGAFGALTTTLIAAATNGVASENASTNLRFAITQLQTDIQAATPDPSSPIASDNGLDLPTGTNPLATANLQLQLQLGPVGSQQTITWAYDPSTHDLTRSVSSSPTSSPTSTTTELTGVDNACTLTSCPLPVFAYWGQNGLNLLSSSSTPSPSASSVPDCTARVEVYLSVKADRSPLVPEQRLNVQLANITPGGLACG